MVSDPGAGGLIGEPGMTGAARLFFINGLEPAALIEL